MSSSVFRQSAEIVRRDLNLSSFALGSHGHPFLPVFSRGFSILSTSRARSRCLPGLTIFIFRRDAGRSTGIARVRHTLPNQSSHEEWISSNPPTRISACLRPRISIGAKASIYNRPLCRSTRIMSMTGRTDMPARLRSLKLNAGHANAFAKFIRT